MQDLKLYIIWTHTMYTERERGRKGERERERESEAMEDNGIAELAHDGIVCMMM